MPVNSDGYDAMVIIYSSDKTRLTGFVLKNAGNTISSDSNGNVSSILLDYSNIAYIRISAGNIDKNSIITVNEPI